MALVHCYGSFIRYPTVGRGVGRWREVAEHALAQRLSDRGMHPSLCPCIPIVLKYLIMAADRPFPNRVQSACQAWPSSLNPSAPTGKAPASAANSGLLSLADVVALTAAQSEAGTSELVRQMPLKRLRAVGRGQGFNGVHDLSCDQKSEWLRCPFE